jgi:hypothetical protein
MNFDVTVTHEARCTRVRMQGPARAGRVLSLLQVLSVDSASWTTAAVLVDLRGVQPPLQGDEQSDVAEAAARAFGPRPVALLAAPADVRGIPGLRSFADDAAAQDWLAGA